MKKLFILFYTVAFSISAYSQKDNIVFEFVDGYALIGKDTIQAQIKITNPIHSYSFSTITMKLANQEINFPAGGLLKGFGFTHEGRKYDFGNVEVESGSIGGTMTRLRYIQKIVTGNVELYKYEYMIGTTKRTYVDGMLKPGATTREHVTNYFIAKNDSIVSELATPRLLQSFRVKNIEPYISEYTGMIKELKKRVSPEELVTILEEYNQWNLTKPK